MIRKLTVILLSVVICLLAVSSTFALKSPVYSQVSGVYSTLSDYEKLTGKKIEKFNEAPMLEALVDTGELPSIEERLPEEPLVVEPWEEIGKYGGTLRVGMNSASAHSPAVQLTIEYLLMWNRANTEVIPNIAKGFELTNEGKLLTLHLRKGMKWSDGLPFTVDDILFWWEDVILNDELTPIKPTFWMPGGELMKVKKIDEYTIELHFAEACYVQQEELANLPGAQGHFFLPKHALKEYHIKYNKKADELAKKEGYDYWWQLFQLKSSFGWDRQQWPDVPSLGPWVTKKVLPDGIIFERNPYYFKVDTAGNQLPYIDICRGIIYGKDETRLLFMMSGKLDCIGWNASLMDYPVLVENAEKGGYRVWTSIYGTRGADAAYFFNQNYTEDPVIGDILREVRFRQALSLAINREEINKVIALGHGVPRQATVAPNCAFYEDWWAKSYAEYNPEKANKLLDEMGLNKKDKDGYRLRPDGKRLNIIVTLVSRNIWVPTTELVKEYWEEVGVRVTMSVVETGYFWTFCGATKHQINVWVLAGVVPSSFYSGRAKHFASALMWANEWKLWWNTKGEQGEEPPEEIKRMWSLCDSLPLLPREQADEAAKEICSIEAENLYFVGTIGLMPKPIAVDANLGNVYTDCFAGAYACAGIRNWLSEEWFWKK